MLDADARRALESMMRATEDDATPIIRRLARVQARHILDASAGGDAGAVERERDEARQIVRDIYWMARRYADGRQSYAVGMFNDAVRKAYDAGWLTHRMNDEPAFARDGMFSGEWKSIEQRARDAEERLAALALPAPVVEGDTRERFKMAMADAARVRGGAGAHFIANGEKNLWLDIAYDAFAALSEGRSHG